MLKIVHAQAVPVCTFPKEVRCLTQTNLSHTHPPSCSFVYVSAADGDDGDGGMLQALLGGDDGDEGPAGADGLERGGGLGGGGGGGGLGGGGLDDDLDEGK